MQVIFQSESEGKKYFREVCVNVKEKKILDLSN
jgi:hypothetical protein